MQEAMHDKETQLIEHKTINGLKTDIKKERLKGKKIGFVPTMGYFHEGHLELMRIAKRLSDICVVSIFVNPTQFGPNEDLDRYPRDLKKDRELASSVGVDYLFVPEVNEMYPEGYSTYVEVFGITEELCGKSRPGHFRGVATVVTKLFNIVQPDLAVFGQKDYQQLLTIKRMVKDLNMDIEIIAAPIIREKDGLAMSSRNSYLTSEERQAALVLYKSLLLAQEILDSGETRANAISNKIKKLINSEKLVSLEYIEIRNPETLMPVKEIENETLVALAAKIGKTRLIDNTIIKPKR